MIVRSDRRDFGIAEPNAREVLERRSRHAKHFSLGEGRMLAVISRDMHYRTAGGQWDDVRLDWREDRDEHVVTHAEVNFRSDAKGLLAWQRDAGKGIRFLTPVRPEIHGRRARLAKDRLGNANTREAWAKGLDWHYAPRVSGLKLEATVAAPRGPEIYRFRYELHGGARELVQGIDGSLLSDVFVINRPIVIGADHVAYECTGWEIEPGGWISFAFDDSQLPPGAYPYVIDPTTTFEVAVSGDDGEVGTGWETSYPPTTVTSVDTTDAAPGPSKQCDNVPSPTKYKQSVALVRWDTSLLPDDAVISSALARLRVVGVWDDGNRGVTFEWYEPGTIAAGDYSTTVSSTAHAAIDLTSISVGADLDVDLLSPAANISLSAYSGLRLHISGGALSPVQSAAFFFASFDHATLQGPRLLVTYTSASEEAEEEAAPAGSGGGGISASPALPHGLVEWKTVLCEWAPGVCRPLASWTKLARNRRTAGRMNRPASFAGRVPSDHALVATLHTDGRPYLSKLCRAIKAYRRERFSDGTESWVLRFGGRIWQVQDVGDENGASTSFVAFDPLHDLLRRYTAPLRSFTDVDGAQIAKQLVDETNAIGPTPLTTDGGAFEGTPLRTAVYQYKNVANALAELANAFNGFDLQVTPVDRDDGVLGVLSAFARLGMTQPSVVFGWGIAPHNVKKVDNLDDGEVAANAILGLGANQSGADQLSSGWKLDGSSVEDYGRLEDIDSFSDVSDQEFLDALTSEELGFRSRGRQLVSIIPQPDRAPEPFTHWHMGDLVYVYAGARLRGGFAGAQRIYGYTLDLSDEGVESVSEIVTSPES